MVTLKESLLVIVPLIIDEVTWRCVASEDVKVVRFMRCAFAKLAIKT